MTKTVMIDDMPLTLETFWDVVEHRIPVQVGPNARQRMQACNSYLHETIDKGDVVYGVNTGFGKLSTVVLSPTDLDELQLNLLRSHACGVGDPFPETVVRAMMLLRLVSLSRGYSGVRPIVVDTLAACLNAGVHPVIPQQGSLGASGDLAPLAHLALVLIGEGEAWWEGQRVSGREALEASGISPLRLAPKEGLALINGTQAMTAVGLLAHRAATYLAEAADCAASLTMQALRGIEDAFDDHLQQVRGYPEQIEVASRIREWTEGSRLTQDSRTAITCGKVQDAYAIRCVPQVHGASLRVLRQVEDTLKIEMNAVTDNPLLFPEEGLILSGGNFHGQPVALVMDCMKIAVAEWANISERRTERLLNPSLNEGLPPFLAAEPGLQSGLMILQYTAASLVSENKVLAHPASVDSIPSSANQEDHVSMGTIAARQAMQITQNTARVLAIELICAAAALEFRGIDNISPVGKKVVEWIRNHVVSELRDRSYSRDVEILAEALLSGGLHKTLANSTSYSTLPMLHLN